MAHSVTDSVARKVKGNRCLCCNVVYGSRTQLISHLRPMVSPVCRALYASLPDADDLGVAKQGEFRLGYTRRGRKRRMDGLPVSDMVVPIMPDECDSVDIYSAHFAALVLLLFGARIDTQVLLSWLCACWHSGGWEFEFLAWAPAEPRGYLDLGTIRGAFIFALAPSRPSPFILPTRWMHVSPDWSAESLLGCFGSLAFVSSFEFHLHSLNS
eukprot:5457238-Amphidinium_carterae.1